MARPKKRKNQVSAPSRKAKRKLSVIAFSQSADFDSLSAHLKSIDAIKSGTALYHFPGMEELPEQIESGALKSSLISDWRKSIPYSDDSPLLLIDLDEVEPEQIPVLFESEKTFYKKNKRCLAISGDDEDYIAGMALIPVGDLEKLQTHFSEVNPLKSLEEYCRLFFPKALVQLKENSGSAAPAKLKAKERLSAFFNWFVKSPVRSFKAGGALKYSDSPGYRLLFLVTVVFSFFLITHLSQNAGISGDEYRYIDQASNVYDYYASFGKDKSAVSQTGIDPQHYNAQSFDNILYAVQKWIGLEADNFGFRHFWNSVVGWLAMLFAALIALRIGGYRMALLTFILLFISPRFLGHSYNNHRDIPMAASVVFFVLVAIPYLKTLPKIHWKYLIWVALGIAWAYSLRLGGGVLVMGYLLAFTGLAYLIHAGSLMGVVKNIKRAFAMLGNALLVCLLGFGIGVLTWPFALEPDGPIANSLEVLRASADLGVSLRQIFEGEQLWSNDMPWYYTGKWMLITIPAFIIAGFFFSFLVVKKVVNRQNLLPYLMVLTAVVLPIIYALGFVNTHYGGWRHFIFVYPFIVILAALGVEGVFRMFDKKKLKNLIWLAIPVFMFQPISFIVKNHPLEYLYFNELIGGTKGAHGYFETDYSLNSLQQASEWLIENVIKNHDGPEPLIVATNDRRTSLYYFRDYADKVQVVYTRYYEKSMADWDYATFYGSLIHPYQIREGLWPPEGTVHEVLVDGVPIGAVVERLSKDDFRAYEAFGEGDMEAAFNHIIDYIAVNPYSEEMWTLLAQVQSQIGQRDDAVQSAEQALALMPGSGQALLILVQHYFNEGDFSTTLEIAEELIYNASNHFAGHYYKALALRNLNQIPEAMEAAENAIMRNQSFRPAYQLLADCYMQLGDRETAEQILRFMEQQTN